MYKFADGNIILSQKQQKQKIVAKMNGMTMKAIRCRAVFDLVLQLCVL
jgi:hypothetical protein